MRGEAQAWERRTGWQGGGRGARWPRRLCGGRGFPCSLLWRLGSAELRSQTSEAVCGEPAGAGSR